MPKKLDSRKENRGHGGNNADRQERAGKWKDARVHGRPDQPGNLNEPRQQIQENPGNAAGSGDYRQLLQARRKLSRENRQAQGNQTNQTKKGCLPKLFMLALPFSFVLSCLIPGF